MKARPAGRKSVQSVAVATVKRFDEPDGLAFINRRRYQKDPLGSLRKLADAPHRLRFRACPSALFDGRAAPSIIEDTP